MALNLVVIDDNNDTRRSIEKILTRKGYGTKLFEDTRQCLTYLSNLSMNQYPHGYLVDMRIPGDLDGPEVLYNFLKERGKIEGFYFMTGNLSEHDKQVIARTGALYIIKEDDIVETFLQQLER